MPVPVPMNLPPGLGPPQRASEGIDEVKPLCRVLGFVRHRPIISRSPATHHGAHYSPKGPVGPHWELAMIRELRVRGDGALLQCVGIPHSQRPRAMHHVGALAVGSRKVFGLHLHTEGFRIAVRVNQPQSGRSKVSTEKTEVTFCGQFNLSTIVRNAHIMIHQTADTRIKFPSTLTSISPGSIHQKSKNRGAADKAVNPLTCTETVCPDAHRQRSSSLFDISGRNRTSAHRQQKFGQAAEAAGGELALTDLKIERIEELNVGVLQTGPNGISCEPSRGHRSIESRDKDTQTHPRQVEVNGRRIHVHVGLFRRCRLGVYRVSDRGRDPRSRRDAQRDEQPSIADAGLRNSCDRCTLHHRDRREQFAKRVVGVGRKDRLPQVGLYTSLPRRLKGRPDDTIILDVSSLLHVAREIVGRSVL